ncbi:hypothetical protein CHISP_0341 [Chitinispirillum alkaliphilum]|nr:hypothetical protein CHISP_0341 [Chitinispirillum alkaliphilum]
MVLSGSIREYILADVFHLLSQQKITGKLVLTKGNQEGSVIFKDGMITGAEVGEENLETKLFGYLVDIKRKSSHQLQTLFNSHHSNLSSLCKDLIDKNLFTSYDLSYFAELCIEDISCSLFLWKEGKYRFNDMRNVDSLIAGNVNISSENVVMEAMRRVDEWNRMTGTINAESIFVRKNKDDIIEPFQTDIYDNPQDYIYSCLDGTKTVKNLVSSCCLCEYKVYEALNLLIESNRIVPLSPKFSRSIEAALNKTDDSESVFAFIKSTSSFLMALCLSAAIIFAGYATRSVPITKYVSSKSENLIELECALYKEKLTEAKIKYQALFGENPEPITRLSEAKLLNPNICKGLH